MHDASAAVRPSGVGTSAGASRTANSHGTWSWPVPGARTVLRGYEAPASRYSAGHRGIDIAAVTGTPVVSPASGTVRFAGVVVDRPTITVATVDGVLISLEPVASPLAAGDVVAGGQSLGRVAAGGHCNAACVHLGVRVNGDYASPLLFFGGVPRAVLLPLN
ncbi:peptidoglycan DD-metalloendopeptidase family protein [Humibacter ginsenosidimutans]|uniref:Peptidoglycan DD-metalloendopeptidase family protein n=1 Tax=Humibacter ginsenosidimutans TaxID=2599293 RepID=A0A5B8M203_9MICO|nr:peptidoglycan DD-metalloendopeptidase family protein [Humibacter ginsenosidimutans]